MGSHTAHNQFVDFLLFDKKNLPEKIFGIIIFEIFLKELNFSSNIAHFNPYVPHFKLNGFIHFQILCTIQYNCH